MFHLEQPPFKPIACQIATERIGPVLFRASHFLP